MSKIVFNIIFELANFLLLINLIFSIKKLANGLMPRKFYVLFIYLAISSIEYLVFELKRFDVISIFSNQLLIDLFFVLIHFLLLANLIFTEIHNKSNKNLLFTIE